MKNSYDTREPLAHRVSTWLEAQGCDEIALSVVEGSDIAGPNYDYSIVQEIRIRPSRISELGCEISICDDGAIGIGIGSWSDAASRLGLAPTRAKRYLGGVEPTSSINFEDLIFLLDAIRRGEVSAWCFSLPILGIVDTRIVISEAVDGFPRALRNLMRIKSANVEKDPMVGSLLKFDPWT